MRVMGAVCAKAGVANAPASRARTRLRSVNMVCLVAVRRFRRGATGCLDAEHISKGKTGMRRANPWLLKFGQLRPPSLAVADQDPVATRANLRSIGLQTCQHPQRVLKGGLAEPVHSGSAVRAVLRRTLPHGYWRKGWRWQW